MTCCARDGAWPEPAVDPDRLNAARLSVVALPNHRPSPAEPIPADIKGDRVPRQVVYTPKAAMPPATYSQAVKAAGLVFVSGTAPHDPVNGQIKGTTIQEQTRQCLTNIAAILEEAGSSLDKIVSVTIVLADEDDFAGMNEEWLLGAPLRK